MKKFIYILLIAFVGCKKDDIVNQTIMIIDPQL